MFDHSLRNFVLKFAELRDLQDSAEQGKNREGGGRRVAESDLSVAAQCEMIHGE